MLVAFASLLFMTASAPAEVFFAKDFLEVGDAGGALWTSWFVGMAIEACSSRDACRRRARRCRSRAIDRPGIGLAAPTLPLVFTFALVSYVVGGLRTGRRTS